MHEGLEEVITRLAKIEAAIEECDEWQQNYWSYHAKGELFSNYGSDNEEALEAMEVLRERIQEAERLYEGAKLELTKLTRLDVEQSRKVAHEIRTYLSEYMARVHSELRQEASEMSSEELLAKITELSQGD